MTLDERPRAAWAWAAGLGAALLHLPSLAGPFLFDDAFQGRVRQFSQIAPKRNRFPQ